MPRKQSCVPVARPESDNIMSYFACDSEGHPVNCRTKTYGWVRIDQANVYYLLKLQARLLEAGREDTKVWHALEAEISRRRERGELRTLPGHINEEYARNDHHDATNP